MGAKSKTIWVVEDDPSFQRIISQSLQQHNYEAIIFDTAEKAFAALRCDPLPDLVILDMLLPGMSGVDLIRLLKQNDQWKAIPVVVVTVLSKEETSSDVSKAYWVNKPFDTANLIQTIEGILSTVR